MTEPPGPPSPTGPSSPPGAAADNGPAGPGADQAQPPWRSAYRPEEELRAGPAVLRRIRPEDAADLAAAVLASLDHLRPWMPWADPYGPDDAVAFATAAVTGWEEGTELAYRISSPPNSGPLGASGLVGVVSLMARIGPGGLEIGYWLRADAVGRGLATGAAAAVTVAALGLPDVGFVEIHHDVGNERSGAVPRRLGFTRLADVSRPPAAPAETGITARWSLTIEQLAGSPAHSMTKNMIIGKSDEHL